MSPKPLGGVMNSNILFSNESICSILVECYGSSQRNETGGIFVGPKNMKNIVTETIPSTHFAERKPSTYYQNEKDVSLLNRELKKYQKIGFDFNGYWHKHPSGFRNLSSGDKQTCIEILTSSNYKINNRLIMAIITESTASNIPIFTYIVKLSNRNNVEVHEANIKVLPKHCILECAECFTTPERKGKYESLYYRQCV